MHDGPTLCTKATENEIGDARFVFDQKYVHRQCPFPDMPAQSAVLFDGLQLSERMSCLPLSGVNLRQ